MWQLKLKVMAAIGAASVFLGTLVRFCEVSWSRDVADLQTRLGITEAATWAIAFGILVLALALNRWVAGDPEKSATQS